MITLPAPAVIELDGTPMPTASVRQQVNPDQTIELIWDEETENPHYLSLVSLAADGTGFVGVAPTSRQPVIIRPIDPYDGIAMSKAGVPHPLEVIAAQLNLEGTIMAEELQALVAADNTVVTLLLETGIGTYVRYLGDWQLLDPNTDSLDDLEVLSVAPEAIGVWDAADAANTSIRSSDLPVVVDNKVIIPPDLMPGEDLPLVEEGVRTARGSQIPAVASAADLPRAIQQAHVNPGIRWFVAKRAAALGKAGLIPPAWEK